MTAPSNARTRVGLDQIANEIALRPRLWRRHIQRRAEHRWASHLIVAAPFSAWLIGWPPGTDIALHDHGTSDSALCVVRGRLVERRLDGHHHDDLDEPGWRVLPTGFVSTCASDCVHALANFDDSLALSIHVYSPVLNTLGFYNNADGEFVASHVEEVIDDRVSLW